MLPKARGYLKPSFCNLFANLAHVPGSASWRPVGAESNLIFCICLNHLEAVEVCGIVQDPTQSGTVQSWPTSLIENVPGLLFEELLDSPHNDCTTVELVGTTLPHLSLLPFTGSQKARLLMAFALSSLHIASSSPMRGS